MPTKFGVLTNQNTTKKVGYKRILISASIGVFPLIIVYPINIHMHRLLLGKALKPGLTDRLVVGRNVTLTCCLAEVVFFFGYVTMPAAKQRGNGFFSWVRSENPLPREDLSLSTIRIAGGCPESTQSCNGKGVLLQIHNP
jgi:hypothetical protein